MTLRVLLLLFGSIVSWTAWAEQRFTTRDGLTASVTEGACGLRTRVTVQALDASAYAGDRLALQRLLGGIRAALTSDCPHLQTIDVTGLAGGRAAFQGTISAAEGWQLVPSTATARRPAEAPATGRASGSAACDYDPNVPFVGCYVLVHPRNFAGMITNIRRDGSWYQGWPASLAAGTPEKVGRTIEQRFMDGTVSRGPDLRFAGPFHFIAQDGLESPWIGPYFGYGCLVLKLNPHQMLDAMGEFLSALTGASGGSSRTPVIMLRLKPLEITADIFAPEGGRGAEIRTSIPDPDRGPLFNRCPENFDEDIGDDLLFNLALVAVPLVKMPALLPRRLLNRPRFVERLSRGGTGAAARSTGQVGHGAEALSLRQQYVREVSGLTEKANAMRRQGSSSEEIARTLSAERRRIGVVYKDRTPPEELARIYQRNEAKYGDKLGPTVDWLRGQGRTWEQIIEGATRPGGGDLGY